MRTAAPIALVLCTSALATHPLHAWPRRSRGEHRVRASAFPRAEVRAEATGLDLATRRMRALDAFARSGHIRRCWMQQLQRDATTGPRTLSVRLEVDAVGRTRGVSVADPDAPMLARCLAAGAWSLEAVGPGEPFRAEGTLRLDRGE